MSEADEFERMMNLFNYNGPGKIISSHEMKKILDSDPGSNVEIRKTGFPSLDRLTEGFRGGELIIISGPTKNGKTLFCQTLTENFTLAGINSLWFSYELGPKEFLNRFYNIPFFLMPDAITEKSQKWISDRVYEAKLKHQIKVVFIDHLHFLVDMEKLKNASFELGALVRSLKRLAIEANVVIFLVSHIRKLELDKEPTENDLRDTSFSSQEADSTFMIWRKKIKNVEETWVNVRNHRRTGVMAEGFRVLKVKDRFQEVASEDFHD